MLTSSALSRTSACRVCLALVLLCASLIAEAGADSHVRLAPVPAEVSSTRFVVSIDGQQTPVMHAAGGYYLLNFDVSGPVVIKVTASDPHYWDAGVEVQPLRHGIRPRREGGSITFPLDGPAKLSITRPGEHYGDSEMLFLFANEPDRSNVTPGTPGIRYYGPGVHHENIDAHDGDRIYLADGAVVFGSLNIWRVHDVKVFGRGTIVYDGPQDPLHDEGWMHKPNWHVIVMDNAHDIEIEGITGIVRSRTWMVQMRDSRYITFRNVKILGNCPGNANQDGLDWLGGGDTLVQDSFFRASDDIFAMYGNWDGYTDAALTSPGHEVSNIVIENSVLSTSISNVVRLGWPRKIFDSHNFTLKNSDVIHMGQGGCGIPFALFELWADQGGQGHHTGYHFSNLRLEDWYSLLQLQQSTPGIRGVTMDGIWALDGPAMVASSLKGDVSDVSLGRMNLGWGVVEGSSSVPLKVSDSAEAPRYRAPGWPQGFSYPSGLLRPGEDVAFTANGSESSTYHWLFGDGAKADGRKVHHRFTDADGTLLDGSGRFHVLLMTSEGPATEAWSSAYITVAKELRPAQSIEGQHLAAGLARLTPGSRLEKGLLQVPADGGYTLTLLSSTTAWVMIDGTRAASKTLRPQVCGSPGYAVQAVKVSVALAKGLHVLEVQRGGEVENARSASGSDSDGPVLLWEGPGISAQEIPAGALFHAASE